MPTLTQREYILGEDITTIRQLARALGISSRTCFREIENPERAARWRVTLHGITFNNLAEVRNHLLQSIASSRLSRGPCRHCHLAVISRPRGLCWNCYYRAGVREQYSELSKFGRRGVGNGHRADPPLPACPTTAPPGSPEKVAVLEERASQGVSLWHPLDPTLRRPGGKIGGWHKAA